MLLLVVLLLAMPIFSIACASEEPAAPSTPSTPSEPSKPAAEPIELSMASMHSPTSPSGQQLEEWAKKIAEDSNGLVTIRHYGSSTLVPGPDMRTGIKEGVLVIATVADLQAGLGASDTIAGKVHAVIASTADKHILTVATLQQVITIAAI